MSHDGSTIMSYLSLSLRQFKLWRDAGVRSAREGGEDTRLLCNRFRARVTPLVTPRRQRVKFIEEYQR